MEHPASIRAGSGLWRRVVEGRAIQTCEDHDGGRRVGAPLLAGGRTVGVVVIVLPRGEDHIDRRLAVMQYVLTLGSAALERCIRAS